MTERIRPLRRDEIDGTDVQRLRTAFPRVDQFFVGPDPRPMPPVLGLLAHHPDITGPWLAFSGALLDGGVLDERTRELLILATAHRTATDYIWHEHQPLAARAGITADEIAAIEAGAPHDWTDAELTLFAAVGELVEGQVVDDATWAALATFFEPRALLEILFVIGAYSCLAMVLNGSGLAFRDQARGEVAS